MLDKIISGAQNGADIAGLIVAKEKGIVTGGTMPKGWRTLDGPRPEYAELYGITEHTSSSYVPRTFQNVKDADATIRFAWNIESSGEKCTLKAITQYSKPYFDVYILDTTKFVAASPKEHPIEVAKWLYAHKIKVLNVAGNSEKTAPGIEVFVRRFVGVLIDEIRKLNNAESTPPIIPAIDS